MGLNQNFPQAVAMGPRAMLGGLAVQHLPTEQGIQQILTMLNHIFNNTLPGWMIHRHPESPGPGRVGKINSK